MPIHLVLADDWELRGNGSGDPFLIQFNTARALMDIYDTYGLKGTFNAEVMQQFYHHKYSDRYPQLGEIYNEWERVVKEMFTRGHDVQLHIHPQWIDAKYKHGKWVLESDWDLTNYSRETIRNLVLSGIDYLESILRPLDKNYKCVSYRGGAWVFAPSKDVIETLIESDIKFDMSIVKGLYVKTPVNIDYRYVEEGIYPYYPKCSDARLLNQGEFPLTCIPTHRMYARPELAMLVLKGLLKFSKVRKLSESILSFIPASAVSIVNSGCKEEKGYLSAKPPENRSSIDRVTSRARYLLKKTSKITDISSLSYFECKKAVEDIRNRYKNYPGEYCPFIFACHTKNIGNFRVIERFMRYLSQVDDLEVITATQLSNNLESGLYRIRTANK